MNKPTEDEYWAFSAMADMLQPWTNKALIVFRDMSRRHGATYAIEWFEFFAEFRRAPKPSELTSSDSSTSAHERALATSKQQT